MKGNKRRNLQKIFEKLAVSKTNRKKLTATKERKTRKHGHDLELKLAKIINRAAD